MSEQPGMGEQSAPTTTNGKEPVLRVEDIHTFYGAIEALKGITIEVQEGEIVTLIGSNGAGKTTTLRSISGIVAAAHRQDLLRGPRDPGPAGHQVAQIGIAHSPEGRRIFPRMTVLENLEMGAFTRKDNTAIREDVERVYYAVPAPQGAREAEGRHDVRRRAADARDGPGADGATRSCCSSTSRRSAWRP